MVKPIWDYWQSAVLVPFPVVRFPLSHHPILSISACVINTPNTALAAQFPLLSVLNNSSFGHPDCSACSPGHRWIQRPGSLQTAGRLVRILDMGTELQGPRSQSHSVLIFMHYRSSSEAGSYWKASLALPPSKRTLEQTHWTIAAIIRHWAKW